MLLGWARRGPGLQQDLQVHTQLQRKSKLTNSFRVCSASFELGARSSRFTLETGPHPTPGKFTLTNSSRVCSASFGLGTTWTRAREGFTGPCPTPEEVQTDKLCKAELAVLHSSWGPALPLSPLQEGIGSLAKCSKRRLSPSH